MILQFITSLLEGIKQQHKKINSFGIGELDELNHSNNIYPMLYFYLDQFQTSIQYQTAPEEVSVSIKIGVYSNILEDAFGNQLVLNQSTTNDTYNKTSALIVDGCVSMLNDIIFKLDELSFLPNSDFELVNSNTITVQRIMMDDICGADATLNLRITNFDFCNYRNNFN